jgi:hypothetical protein
MFSFALAFHRRQNCVSNYLESDILAKVKNPYWRAAFWTAVIQIPSYLMLSYVAAIIQLGPAPQNLPKIVIIAAEVGSIPQLPGILLTNILAILFSRPVLLGFFFGLIFNWLSYYFVLLAIFRWRRRRAMRAAGPEV